MDKILMDFNKTDEVNQHTATQPFDNWENFQSKHVFINIKPLKGSGGTKFRDFSCTIRFKRW